MKLDHTLVPAEDKEASARFFAKIMGLEYAGIDGDCGIVRVDDTLLLPLSTVATTVTTTRVGDGGRKIT